MGSDQSVLKWGDMVVVQQITKDLPSNAIDNEEERFSNWYTMEEQCGVGALPDFGSMALPCRGQCTCLEAFGRNSEYCWFLSKDRSSRKVCLTPKISSESNLL